jgi:hypothetical protein
MNLGRSSGASLGIQRPPETGSRRLAPRIVTLAFLSEKLPASLVSSQLAGSLCAETQASVIIVRFAHESDAGRRGAALAPELYLNGEFHLPAQVHKTEAGFSSITLTVGADPPTPTGLDSLVAKLSSRFRYVLIELPVRNPPSPWVFELLRRSNAAYVFLHPTSEGVYHLNVVSRGTGSGGRDFFPTIKPIVCLGERERVDGIDSLANLVGNPVHFFVHDSPAGGEAETLPARNLFRADLRRLAREIGGRLVGLALSSGAAKGFAHVGVIQVLEENGIEIDVVSGASMGAYVGCLWAHGCDGTELERLSREMESRWAFWTLIDPVFPPRQGFLRGNSVKKRLMRSIGTSRIWCVRCASSPPISRRSNEGCFQAAKSPRPSTRASLCPEYACPSRLRTEKPTSTAG